MKSIAYVIPSFPVLSETFVVNEMTAMAELGHKILPIALETRPEVDNELHRHWVRHMVTPWNVSKLSLAKMLMRAPFNPELWRFLASQSGFSARGLLLLGVRIAVQAKGCDHIHAHFAQHSAAAAIVAARLLGITVSFVGHGADVYRAPADLELKLRHSDLSIAVCREMREMFSPHCKGITALVPCGIDTNKFSRQAPSEGDKRLLFVGRLVEKKGLDTLLMAMALLGDPELELDIVGDGPLKQQWQTLAKAMGLTGVRFLGARPQSWLASEGSHYLAMVAPYRVAKDGDRDTGPLICKEAMAMGLPVIASSLMGLKELVSSRTGFRVRPDDPQSLKRAIRALLAMPEAERQKLGLKGRERVRRHYELKLQARRLSSLVEAL
ncbi:glycosyltransferase [Ferrimonas sp. YFM]|uniref:glycosyltransferase n=1 Tax=Ferrimonas sp. YFM TaxID=3028878 RepID=UPI0025735375|nr:glycosyltransferase [Ferrimonas sp. YFM]BDY04920.1 colanic acid biosynthesis glycosyltransferase WcaL [Ferrimonas sp. YFM]